MSAFERYLSVWVALAILAGLGLGQVAPGVVGFLAGLEYGSVNFVVAILIWFMVYPMMVAVDFRSLARVHERPKGMIITLAVNWLIKPFTMAALGVLFFDWVFAPFIEPGTSGQYIAGLILLGAAPCTAMVFVWSYLADGDPAYTLVQVAVNDLIMLVAFVPIVSFLLGIGGIPVPWDTMALSVILFVVVPLAAGWFTRKTLIARKGLPWFEQSFLPRFGPVTIVALLATLVTIFIFQGEIIVNNPLHIVLIAIPLIIQTYFIFAVAYGWAYRWRIEFPIAAPGGFIGASNFFELAVAVSIALFGLTSGATLTTVVGVLVEVPVMLSLVWIAKRTRGRVERRSGELVAAEGGAA